MSEYGKQGKEYILDDHSISVNQEFLLSTIMATIVVLKEITGIENIDITIEAIAEELYDRFTKTEHGTTEERTGQTGN